MRANHSASEDAEQQGGMVAAAVERDVKVTAEADRAEEAARAAEARAEAAIAEAAEVGSADVAAGASGRQLILDEVGTGIVEAAECGDEERVRALLERGVETDETYTTSDGKTTGVTLLMLAAALGHEAIVEMLLEHGASCLSPPSAASTSSVRCCKTPSATTSPTARPCRALMACKLLSARSCNRACFLRTLKAWCSRWLLFCLQVARLLPAVTWFPRRLRTISPECLCNRPSRFLPPCP